MKSAAGMAATPGSPEPNLRIRARRGVQVWWLGLLPVMALFFAAAWHMRIDWTYDESYHYGWVVPALMAYLLSVRWRDRPAAEPNSASHTALWVALGIAFVLSWLIREANPDWRLIGVALGGLAVAAGMLWFREVGGRAWQWHFAGAVAFFAVAVPWPTVLERAISGVLMPANAALALEALHWLGVPAIRSGNLITLPEGTLGVEEACSGIRSLQATVMMALFLGELYWLQRCHRWTLLGIGVGIALLTNALRTIFLSVLAARFGLSEASRWHDAAGLTVLALHAIVLFAATHGFARRAQNLAAAIPRSLPASWPIRGPAVLACALMLALPVTHVWFDRHGAAPPVEWSLEPPREAPEFEQLAIPNRTRLILRYDAGWSARWNTAQGHRLHAFFLQWNPGSVPPENLAAHHPGNCLSILGMTLEEQSPDPLIVPGPMGQLPLTLFRFNDRGRPLYVFHAVEESASRNLAHPEDAEGLTYRGRLRAAWLGRRSESLRLIEIGIWNAATAEEARDVAADFLRGGLR